jgi:phage gp37-like protein
MNFETIEDKIIEKLKAGLPHLKTCETYAGQMEGEIERMPVRFPAVYVVYGGSTFEEIDGPNHREIVGFSIMACAKDLRGNEAIRKEEGGAYGLVNDVLEKLTNENFGLDIEKLRPVKVSLVFISKIMAVYGIDFQTGFDKEFEWE